MPKSHSAIRRRLHSWLEITQPGDVGVRVFNGLLFSLIILNALAVIVESLPLSATMHATLKNFETFSMWVFTLEYAARLWSCNEVPRYAHPWRGRVRYAFTPLLIVDLLTILPFWLQLMGVNASMLRILRFFRLLKFTRLVRYSKAYLFISSAVTSRKDEFVVALFLMLVTLLVASSLLYFAEHEAQPAVFSSIPATFWWGVVTFTSVGYGDTYPVTTAGKVIGGLFSIVGISIFALPTAILTAGLLDQIHLEREKRGSARSRK